MLDMFKGEINSPETTITNDISNADTIIYILDETKVPAELPNLMTLGTGTAAETVKVLSVNGSALTVERGFQVVPKAWNAGTIIARNFTEYDYEALRQNISTLDGTVGSHLADVANPHNTTAAQVGAVNKTGDTMTGSLTINHTTPLTLEGAYPNARFKDADAADPNDLMRIMWQNEIAYIQHYDASAGTWYDLFRIHLSDKQAYLEGGSKKVWHEGISGPFHKGAGSPEGVVTASIGAIYQRTDGGANTTLYVKESGTGNTGWVAK